MNFIFLQTAEVRKKTRVTCLSSMVLGDLRNADGRRRPPVKRDGGVYTCDVGVCAWWSYMRVWGYTLTPREEGEAPFKSELHKYESSTKRIPCLLSETGW